MQNCYCKVHVNSPNFETLGYISAIANLDDKHDRSAPSNHHWKILKCRMIIFSNSSILASPDKNEIKQVHIIFNKVGDDYDKLNSLFLKYSLVQQGNIKKPTVDIFQACFNYTMIAKLAPVWNTVANNYLINNRDFLTTSGPQEGVRYLVSSEGTYIEKIWLKDENFVFLPHRTTNSLKIWHKILSHEIKDKHANFVKFLEFVQKTHSSLLIKNMTILQLKPVKINLIRIDEDILPGEWIRVLPSLNKATVDASFEKLPAIGSFRSYKDLRRHWKNIHGYRLPEQEGPYCSIQFWRGEPLTYPKLCVIRNFPIITPITTSDEQKVLARFINCLQSKMSHYLGMPMDIRVLSNSNDIRVPTQQTTNIPDTQTVSLCTPSQYQKFE